MNRSDWQWLFWLGLAVERRGRSFFTFTLALAFVIGCVDSIEPASSTSACERLSPTGECAVVYQCARRVDGERVELCIREQDLELAQQENGPCSPSRDPRFAPYADLGVSPPCFWCCGEGCGPGANAKNGSFCGGVQP